MLTVGAFALFGVIWFWVLMRLGHWKWSACDCGRESAFFPRKHEKEWIMWTFIVWNSMMSVVFSLTGSIVPGVLIGLLAVWEARVIVEHRKGKKSLLKKALGRVVINRHGRLAVER